LEAAGVEVTAVDAGGGPSRAMAVLLRVLSKVYYANARYARMGFIETHWRERHAYRLIAALDPAIDVLFVHALGATSLPRFDTRRRYFVLLDTTWDLWRQYSTDVFRVSERLAAYADKVEAGTFRQAAHCFAISEYAARNLVDHYRIPREKISVIGTGRGALAPYHGPKDYSNGSILFTAKVRFADKGGYRLLEAFQLARKRNPQLSLTIVGQPEYETEFRNVEGVTALGHVPLERLQQLFNEASLFAMPASFEPWGLVYLEALACRTPVLGLNEHALPEITRDGRFGFCLRTGAVEEIADALVDAFAKPERLARMGKEGQEHCLATFTWAQVAQRILAGIDRTQ
jgi:glycosyltransferase involved in cell wall biosynthesis